MVSNLEWIALGLLALSGLMGFYRVFAGPSHADRIVAADALSLMATMVLIIMSALFNSPLYLDIALLYAVLSFVGIIILAHIMEQFQEQQSGANNNK